MATLLEINTPLGQGKALITQLIGREQLGQMPQYEVTFLTDKPSVTASDMLARDITVGLDQNDHGDMRYFNGYVTDLHDNGTVDGDHFGKNVKTYCYVAVMRPWLYFLTRRSNSRIFQDKNVPDIIEAVFKEYPFAEFKRNLNGTYRKLEYCCQYRETDFVFVCRLMEHEGIYFWFSHEDGKHVMQLCDGPPSHKARPGFESGIFDDTAGGTRDAHRVTSWHSSMHAQSGRFSAIDYNFKTPKADMSARAKKAGGYALDNFELFDHGEQYDDKSQGDNYAKVRAEEFAGRHQGFKGTTPIRGLAAGQTFKLTRHPRDDFNKEYLIVSSNFTATNGHQGFSGGDESADLQCNIAAIDARVCFRPERSIPKPNVGGPQAAVVVGPSGEEIYTDEHGRVKVQFFWDRYSESNENSSCWIRVAQPIAGKEWGAMFLPRIGQEVMVEFFDGDPDRPVITGRLYNADAKPPWTLPANKTRSGFKTRTEQGGTANFNELRFEDKQGSEEIYVRAEKDTNIRIKNDRAEYVGHDSHSKVVKDRFEYVGNDRHLRVAHDHNVGVGDSYSLNVQQDWHAKVGNLFALNSGMEVHLKAGMKAVIEAGTQLSLKVGGSFITIDPSGVSISGPLVRINSGGSAAGGSGASPDAPKDPKEAPDSQGGSSSSSDVKRPQKPEAYSPQAQALKLAHQTAAPVCASCGA
jgi:type VI secretion system secreted protein VgrG